MASQRITIPSTALLLALSAAGTAPAAGAATTSILSLPDLAARGRAFRKALRELTVEPSTPSTDRPDTTLRLESRWNVMDRLDRPSLDEPSGQPGRRDLVFEEQWLIADRQDEHVTAARHWIGNRLKGKRRHGSASPALWRSKWAWDHGPLVGVGRGPISLRGGESQWRLQWSKRWSRSGGPWAARIWVGEEDGETRVGFLVGRSLLDAFGD